MAETFDALIVGAGQGPTSGEIIGNGRATAITFAREGARVLCVDRHLESAAETVAMIMAKGGTAQAAAADVTGLVMASAMAVTVFWQASTMRGLGAARHSALQCRHQRRGRRRATGRADPRGLCPGDGCQSVRLCPGMPQRPANHARAGGGLHHQCLVRVGLLDRAPDHCLPGVEGGDDP